MSGVAKSFPKMVVTVYIATLHLSFLIETNFQVTTIYEREKRYNSEAGGRLAEDQRDTQENVEKVNIPRECQQKGLHLITNSSPW